MFWLDLFFCELRIIWINVFMLCSYCNVLGIGLDIEDLKIKIMVFVIIKFIFMGVRFIKREDYM